MWAPLCAQAVALVLDSTKDQPAILARLIALSRLSVRLQEAGDEAAVLRVLDHGLRELRLAGFVGRLEPDAPALYLFPTNAHVGGLRVGEAPAPGHRLALDTTPLLAQVVRARETVHTDDAISDLGAILPPGEQAAAVRASRRAVVAPMVAHGRTDGLLLVVGDELDPVDGPALAALADHLAVALENATVLRDLKQALLREHAAARELRRLEGLVAELSAENEPQSVLRRLVNATADALGSERVALYLLRQDEPGLSLASSVGLGSEFGQALSLLPLGPAGGPLARAIEDGAPVVVQDTGRDPAWSPFHSASDAAGLRSVWALPLLSRQGEALGVLAVFPDRVGSPGPEQLALAQRYAHHAALAIASSRRQERETHEARTEALAELARSIPHELGQPLAIISGYAELIAEGLLEGERLREACRELVDAAGDLAQLIQRLERVTRYATKDYGSGRTVIDLDRAAEPRP